MINCENRLQVQDFDERDGGQREREREREKGGGGEERDTDREREREISGIATCKKQQHTMFMIYI